MSVKMGDTLPGGWSILNSNIKTRGSIHTFDHLSNLLYGQEEIGDFGMVEIREPSCGPQGRYKDVTGEQGLDVDQGKTMSGLVKYLRA